MTSARKIKIKLGKSKPRNPVVQSLAKGQITGKAGRHQKSASAERREAKKALQKELVKLAR
jgi:hypothetical protein